MTEMATPGLETCQQQLENAWKKTCKVLFGEEIGGLFQYESWLRELIDRNEYRKSSISGKEVAFAIKEYSKDAKCISFDEIDFEKKFEPLNINEIKDMDSIVAAIEDRIYYCGNILLGNCEKIEQSSNITNGFCVYDSANFYDVKYMAYCTVGRENSYCFGGHALGGSEFTIRCSQTTFAKRSFEAWLATNTSDAYYSYGLDGCSNCLFSFNLKNKRNCIGNLELPKDKFDSVKKKLQAEMADELKRRKSLPSLLDIIRKSGHQQTELGLQPEKEEKTDKRVIEREFSLTSRLIFGTPLEGIDNYSDWLFEHVHGIKETRSAISNRKILWLPFGISLVPLPEKRVVTLGEADKLSRLSIEDQDAGSITLKNASEIIKKIAYLKVELESGQNQNMIESTYYMDCADCYRISMTIQAKYCGCSMWPKTSQNCFGVDSVMNSGFCFKCYNSAKLTRCFEMDNCRDCSDSLFCHNCEGLSNCMFCFNTKGKRYAIGNVELKKEEYLRIKKMILGEITKKLRTEKRLEKNIFSLSS